jgi:glutaredoxin 3
MDLERLEPGHRVEMYVSPSCPYCAEARAHFDRRGYPYVVYDAQNDRARRDEMFAYTNDDPTVPAIIVDGAYVQSGWGSPPHG